MDLETVGPLITLKDAGKLLVMDLFSVLRIANTTTGPCLRTIKVSPRRRRTTVAWVEAYLRELNPVATAPESPASITGASARARRAAMIDRELEARGYGRGRQRRRKS